MVARKFAKNDPGTVRIHTYFDRCEFIVILGASATNFVSPEGPLGPVAVGGAISANPSNQHVSKNTAMSQMNQDMLDANACGIN